MMIPRHHIAGMALTCILLSLCSSCSESSRDISRITVSATDTYSPGAILPGMTYLDIVSDTANFGKSLRTTGELLDKELRSDTTNIEVTRYLRSRVANALFKIFMPNVDRRTRVDSELYKTSSFLGYSLSEDTAGVKTILSKPGITVPGLRYRWIPCSDISDAIDFDISSGSQALIAYTDSARSVKLSAKDFSGVRIERAERTLFWRVVDEARGIRKLKIEFSLNDDATERLSSTFRDDSILLLQCNYDNHQFYTSCARKAVDDGMIHFMVSY